MINSRDISELLPEVRKKAQQLIDKCKLSGVDIIITSTYRDYESQNKLFAKGRTEKGKIVTKARGGYSYHNFRVAFDVVPIEHGKAIWDDMELWNIVGRIGQTLGLEWGGTWKFKDRPHFQYTKGKTLQQFREENKNV